MSGLSVSSASVPNELKSEISPAVGSGELVRAHPGHQHFLKHDAVRLEAVGVQVRDIVGDDVELAL